MAELDQCYRSSGEEGHQRKRFVRTLLAALRSERPAVHKGRRKDIWHSGKRITVGDVRSEYVNIRRGKNFCQNRFCQARLTKAPHSLEEGHSKGLSPRAPTRSR